MRIDIFVDQMKDQNWFLSGDSSRQKVLSILRSQYNHDGNIERLEFIKEQEIIKVRLIEINSLSFDGFPVWLKSKTKTI